jgi:hypothetical protein
VEIGVGGLFGLVETCGAFLRSYFDIMLIISNGCPVFYLFYELFGLASKSILSEDRARDILK